MKNETALAGFGVVVLLFAALSTSACGGPSTTFVSSWRPPKAEPLAMRGESVAAVVMMANEITRRNAEDALARELSHYGAKGIPMYSLFAGQAEEGNEAAARAAVEAAGVKGVVVMRPMGKRTNTETSQHSNYDPMYGGGSMYGGYWGGYYGHGWGQPWSYARQGLPTSGPMPGPRGPSTTTTTTSTQVTVVEVLVYSLKQNTLIWAGESESTPPENVDEFVAQLTSKVVEELGNKGLIPSK